MGADQGEKPPLVSARPAFLEDRGFCFYSKLTRFVPGDNIKEIKCLKEGGEKKKKPSPSHLRSRHVGICLGSHLYLLRLDKDTNDGEEAFTRLKGLGLGDSDRMQLRGNLG